jgi:hypothetical protein
MTEYYSSNNNPYKQQIQENKLESALSIIKNIILEKDNKISTLEEENEKLKNKISDLENKLKIFLNNQVTYEDNNNVNAYNDIDSTLGSPFRPARNLPNNTVGNNVSNTSSGYLSNIAGNYQGNNNVRNFSNINANKNAISSSSFTANTNPSNTATTNTGTFRSSNNIITVTGSYKYSPTNLIPSNNTGSSTDPNFNTTSNQNNNVTYNTSSNSTLNSPQNPTNLYSPSSQLNDSNVSRNEVKLFLNEVKEKIPQKEFKEFIKYIKVLTHKNVGGVNKIEIFENVRKLFGRDFVDLYEKFEFLLSIKK